MKKESLNIYLNALFNGLEPPPNKDEILDKAAKILNFKKRSKLCHLSSIVSALGKEKVDPDWYFAAQKLNFPENKSRKYEDENGKSDAWRAAYPSVFPQDIAAGAEVTPDAEFSQDVKKLNELGEESQAYTAYFLAQKYGSRLAYKEMDKDASVFDYNRLMAGLTQCPLEGGAEFCLIKGAISGIQEFIYKDVEKRREIAGGSRKLSKKLRGRSFYVALLTDFIAETLVERLGLQRANLIYSGGGNFLLLAPKTEEAILSQFITEINKMIYGKLGPKVSLVMAWEPCGKDVFTDSSNYYEEVDYRLEESKKQKHLDDLEDFFFNRDAGIEFTEDERLGSMLPNKGKDFLIEARFKNYSKDKRKEFLEKNFVVEFDVANEDTRLIFLAREDGDKSSTDILGELEKIGTIISAKVVLINGTDFLGHTNANKFGFPVSYGFRFIGKYAPEKTKGKEEDEIKEYERFHVMPFENLIQLRYNEEPRINEESQSPLAVLRLDIDDLGFLFSEGLGNRSFPRLASLSREIQFFFAGYLNELAEHFDIYVTYAGGDDAFVVGSWYNMLLFVEALQKDFETFSCKNEHVHFSAGLLTCHVHHPVARFADDAGDLLDDIAKQYKKGGEQVKNAIHVFSQTYEWATFRKMMEFAKDLSIHTNEEGKKEESKFNRSLIHRLLQIIQSGRKDDVSFYRNIGVLHYHMSRRGYTRDKLDKTKKEKASELVEKLLHDFAKKDTIQDYLLPTQFTLLKTRK